jgi:PKHD-type hydroxylase
METYSDFIKFSEKKCLDNYYYYTEAFSEEEINKIEETVKQYQLKDGVVSNRIDKSYRSSKISWIPYSEENKWLYKKIGSLVNTANENMWNFSIMGMKESVQYGEYHASENGHYDWHMDLGGKIINRKISITVQLSDPSEYEGGELQFMLGRSITTAPKAKGNVVVFPSYFLHRVTPVTKGVRKSLVLWVSGEAFR